MSSDEVMGEQLMLVKKMYINNYWRYEFYVPWAKLYVNVSAKDENEARKKALEIINKLKPEK